MSRGRVLQKVVPFLCCCFCVNLEIHDVRSLPRPPTIPVSLDTWQCCSSFFLLHPFAQTSLKVTSARLSRLGGVKKNKKQVRHYRVPGIALSAFFPSLLACPLPLLVLSDVAGGWPVVMWRG